MRIVKEIEIEGKKVLALFDTGALHSYVVKKLIKKGIKPVKKPYIVALGGRKIKVIEECLIDGKIDGYDFSTKVIPIDEIGKINGQAIEVIIGALTMEEWEIIPNPQDGSLDLSGLKKREFTEFLIIESGRKFQ